MLPAIWDRWSVLQEGRRRLTSLVEAQSPEARETPLQEGAWSPLQALEHLMLSERAVVRWILSGREPGKFSLKNRFLKLTMRGFFALKLKTKAPMKQLIPQDSPDLESVTATWSQVHEDLAGYLEAVTADTLGQPVFRHPLAGAMDTSETLDFMIRHQRHHWRQIRHDL